MQQITYRVFKFIREYGLAVTLALVVGVGAIGICAPLVTKDGLNDSNPKPYAPVESRGLTWDSPGPYPVGGPVTLRNGLCNKSDDTLSFTYTLGFEEVKIDSLQARNIIIYPPKDPAGAAGVTPQSRPLAPNACLGIDSNGVSEPLKGNLPLELTPGKWRLYMAMIIMGPASGQIQRLTKLSEPIEVVDAVRP